MKISLLAFAVLLGLKSMAQTADEKNVLELSSRIFQHEVEGKTDSLTSLFDEKLQVVNDQGQIQNKKEYLNTLSSPTFKHDSVNVESSSATIQNNTAILIGKGRFALTISGNKINVHLAYMEVFVKFDANWKLLAIHASMLPN